MTGFDEREDTSKARHPYYQSGRWSPYRPTVAYIGEIAIGLAIVEMSEEVLLRYVSGTGYIRETEYLASPRRYRNEHTWTTTNEIPSGRLRITAYSPYGGVAWSMSWQETKTSTLDGSIATIVRELEKAMPGLAVKLEEAERQAEIRHQEWLATMERQKREDDRRHVAQSIRESRDDLNKVIERWAAVMSIEQFFCRRRGARGRTAGGPAGYLGREVEARQGVPWIPRPTGVKDIMLKGLAHLVLVGIPEAKALIEDDGNQVSNRELGKIDFSALRWSDAEERKCFVNYCGKVGVQINRHGLMPEDSNFVKGDIPHNLWAASGGLLGIVSRIAEEAVIHASERGASQVEREDLEKAIDTRAIPNGYCTYNPFRDGVRSKILVAALASSSRSTPSKVRAFRG